MIKNLLYITILTFFVVVTWISLEVYRNFNPPESQSGIVVEAITPNFDFETINRLKTRTVVPVNFADSAPGTRSAEISVEEEIEETASGSGSTTITLEPSPATASSSATGTVQNPLTGQQQ